MIECDGPKTEAGIHKDRPGRIVVRTDFQGRFIETNFTESEPETAASQIALLQHELIKQQNHPPLQPEQRSPRGCWILFDVDRERVIDVLSEDPNDVRYVYCEEKIYPIIAPPAPPTEELPVCPKCGEDRLETDACKSDNPPTHKEWHFVRCYACGWETETFETESAAIAAASGK